MAAGTDGQRGRGAAGTDRAPGKVGRGCTREIYRMSPNTPSWPLERTGSEVAVPPAVDPGIAPRMQHAPDLPPEPPGDLHRTLTAAGARRWLVLIIPLLGTAAGAVGSRFLDPR